jgi:hypothetical protein
MNSSREFQVLYLQILSVIPVAPALPLLPPFPQVNAGPSSHFTARGNQVIGGIIG